MSNDNLEPLKKQLNNMIDSVSRFIEGGLSNAAAGTGSLPVDVYETDTHVIVKAGPIQGVQPEDIDVSITGENLTIKGESKPDDGTPEGTVLRRERKFGSFSRTIKIPRPVKGDQAEADFKAGILTITLPKVEEAQPKIINVKPVDNE
jgi:HSP20 family protein